MSYLQVIPAGENKLMWFLNGKRAKEIEIKEAEIAQLNEDRIKKEKQATQELAKINKLLVDNPGGIAEIIFYATGGYRRKK